VTSFEQEERTYAKNTTPFCSDIAKHIFPKTCDLFTEAKSSQGHSFPLALYPLSAKRPIPSKHTELKQNQQEQLLNAMVEPKVQQASPKTILLMV
jgi:hypothetical protein